MDTFTDILLDLENPVETTRTRAVINLVRCNDIKAIPHLERAADHDESAQIRYLARKGLKLLKDKAIDEERRRQETHFFASDIEQTVETLVISPDGDDRRRGFQLAARINDPVLYPLLENAYTREETPFLRPFMLRVLAVVGGSKSRHHIEEALESPEHRLRACAVETAAAIRDDELLEKVVPLLRDRDNRVAANATLALKDYGSITVLETLKKMLESPEAGRRDSAAYALAELKNETALPLLAKAARDRAKTIRAKAFTGLEALADDGLAEAAQLIEKLKQEDEEGLADYFALAGEDTAKTYLAHEDFTVRLRAVTEIIKTGDRTRLPAIKEILKREQDTFVKSALVRALGELGGVDEIENIAPYLIEREPRVRANAVEAIGALAGNDSDLKQLLPALNDNNNRVRANAVVALKNTCPEQAMETLKAMATEGDVRMKLSSAYACLETGTVEAVEILANLALERDLRVSEKAVSSLELLQEKGNRAAKDKLKTLHDELDDLSSTDSFIAFEDGSVINLTPGPKAETVDGAGPPVPGQLSVVSSLKAEYGIESDIYLKESKRRKLDTEIDGHGTVAAEKDTMRKRAHLSPGSNKYVVAGEVGRGGMGTILNAFDTDIRREVAMKVITSRRESSRTFLERFVEEAQVQGQLEHPNICPVHELGVDKDGRVYFTMKMVKGASLAQMIKRAAKEGTADDPQRLTEALNTFLKICDGIAYSHSKGVIHRDLKPDNIMVGDFGEVYVMDWGLAKIMGREDEHRESLVITDRAEHDDEMKTMSGSVVGTPAYMPPEQSKGIVEEMDERSDIYSLGALLYELLTLQRPFTGNDPWTVLEKVVKEDPVPLSKRVKGQRFSPELDSIVLKCMEKKKENRYESVMDLKREIELYLSGRPIGAMEYSLWQVFVKWMARNRVLAAASLAVVFVLVTAFAVSYVRISKSNQEAIMQREEAENNMLKAEVRLAMVSEEKRETGEAIRKYREIRRTMVERKNAVYPFIDLKLWKARHAEGRYKEVKNTLQMKTTAAGEPSKEIAAGAVCLDISPDGKTLAVGCSDGTVELWDTQTGGLIEQLEGHFKIVSSLVFSRDGTKLATGDLNLTIRIFSTDQWQQVAEFQGTEIPSPGLFLNKAIISLDFSPDGKTLASVNVGERGIFIWDLEKGNADGTYALKKKLKGHFRAVFSVNYSPDGTYLASASRDEWVWLWEVKNDYQGAKITGHLEDVLRVVFSPDGNLVASASQDSTIKIWDIHRGQEYTTFRGHGSPVTSIDFSPDGKILISGSMDRTVRFWDINRGEEISSYKVPDALVTSVAFSPDGQTAFSSFSDGRVLIWSLEQKKEVVTVKDQFFNTMQVAFSPDGQHLAVGTEAEFQVPIMLLDPVTGKQTALLMGHMGSAEALAFSPDGKVLVSGGKNAILIFWDMHTKAPLFSINPQTEQQTDVFSAVMDTIGKGIKQLFLQPIENNDRVSTVAFSPDGKLLATASFFRYGRENYPSVALWAPGDFKRIHVFEECQIGVSSVAFNPDGTMLAAGSHDGTIYVWNVNTRKLAAGLKGHSGGTMVVTFSPDGRYLVSGGYDSTIIVWDVASMERAGTLTGHQGVVKSLAFSPGGRLLASGSYDTNIIIWDMNTHEAIITLKDHVSEIYSVDFSPDGSSLASGSRNNTVKIWRFGNAAKPLTFE